MIFFLLKRQRSVTACVLYPIFVIQVVMKVLPAVALMSGPHNLKDKQQSKRPTKFPNSVPVVQSDIETLIRQTGQVNPSRAAIGVPSTCVCQHGFSQAFAMDPHHGGRMNSGLLKLTCPHLVRAVDFLEDQGMIRELNERILQEIEEKDQGPLELSMRTTHERHATARKEMLTQQDIDQVQLRLGERGTTAFLEAGVAGSSIGSRDSKCLHAWLADSLFEESSPLGDIIKQELQKQNVNLSGTSACNKLCDPGSCHSFADPPKPRNRQRLRTVKETERRKRRKNEPQQN